MIYFFKNLPSLGALAVPSSFGPRKSKMKTRIQCNINSKILMPVKFQWVSVQWKWRMINIVDFFFFIIYIIGILIITCLILGGIRIHNEREMTWWHITNNALKTNQKVFPITKNVCTYFFSWNQFHDIVFLKMIFVIFNLKKGSFLVIILYSSLLFLG